MSASGRVSLLILALTIGGPANACYNDRDSELWEMVRTPEAVAALTGNFRRLPKRYYEIRIDRLKQKANLTLDEYDDLGVAYDRIGRSDLALATMERKSERGSKSPHDRYRLLANRGTFRAHAYLAQGGKRDARLLELAIGDVEGALRANPKAHFGREGVQLEVLQWVRDIQRGRNPGALSERLAQLALGLAEANGTVDPAIGLAGLIQLGGAWESPDIAAAIGALRFENGVRAISRLRTEELLAKGKKTIDPSLTRQISKYPKDPKFTDTYAKLRRTAEKRQSELESFLTAQFDAGRHPDTDPDFWKAAPPEPIAIDTIRKTVDVVQPDPAQQIANFLRMVALGGALLIGSTALIWWLMHRSDRTSGVPDLTER